MCACKGLGIGHSFTPPLPPAIIIGQWSRESLLCYSCESDSWATHYSVLSVSLLSAYHIVCPWKPLGPVRHTDALDKTVVKILTPALPLKHEQREKSRQELKAPPLPEHNRSYWGTDRQCGDVCPQNYI